MMINWQSDIGGWHPPCDWGNAMKNKALPLLALFFALVGLSLTGCRTMDGAGQDIETAGEEIQDAAR